MGELSTNIPPAPPEALAEALLGWYATAGRALPFRQERPDGTRDPYRVWLAEVIFQQTRIAQGLPYLERFLEAFPTVQHLAAAPQDEVLRLWEGLGYYSRGRNLHAAARQVVSEHGGAFPASLAGLRALPGVGAYTAAAVASLAFGLPHPAIDGNVQRVLARVDALALPVDKPPGQAAIAARAEALMQARPAGASPGTLNEALMELGALVCTPRPLCPQCPLEGLCVARQQGAVQEFPRKSPKKAVVHLELFRVLAWGKSAEGAPALLLTQRPLGSLYAGLWDLPEAQAPAVGSLSDTIEIHDKKLRMTISNISRHPDYVVRHTLTHRRLHIAFHHAQWLGSHVPEGYVLVDAHSVGDYALPRPIRTVLTEAFGGTGLF